MASSSLLLIPIGNFIASSTVWGLVIVNRLYASVFSILTNILPYVIGIVILGILLSIAWRMLRHTRGH